ncbi:MAG: hypothetical protein EAZ99_17975 [Alphaproteobacteria bacterium]|nr:hypothetical protein [Alphaproteobacteria bacterium]TAD87247.1 MAG: hypothetical protein EAZ99_17975 [Alphaproteobacteria bacterium]
MDDRLAEELMQELRTLNANLVDLKQTIERSAGLVAASQLIATDAARSEVFATQLDEHLVEVGAKLVRMSVGGRS